MKIVSIWHPAGLPHRPGIYIVFAGTRALYVGRSVNMWLRWGDHHRMHQIQRRWPHAVILAVPLPKSALADIERVLIKVLNPRLNYSRVEHTPPRWFRALKVMTGDDD